MKQIKQYESYDEYLEDQAEKALNPNGIKIRLKKTRYEGKVSKFVSRFKQFVVKPKSKVLCLGARNGEEVVAFKNLGHDAIGIDIVPFEPLVIKGDFNNLDFKDGEFDLVYCNAIDHTCKPNNMIRGIHRVLTDYGLLWLDTFPNSIGDKEVIDVSNTTELTTYVSSFGFSLVEEANSKPKLYRIKHGKEISQLYRREA